MYWDGGGTLIYRKVKNQLSSFTNKDFFKVIMIYVSNLTIVNTF